MNLDLPNESTVSVEYISGFYPDLAPIHLNLICSLYGMSHPNILDEFDYCELGCGSGESCAVLAAANPTGRFLGIDLIPSHIDQARETAKIGEVENARFLAADVSEYESYDLPQFDYITMHGLITWVPPQVRQAVFRLIADKLKPGGIVYLSYNAMPGWGSVEPLRSYFMKLAEAIDGDEIAKAKRVVEQVSYFRDNAAPYFTENPLAAKFFDDARKADPRYIAHEFLVPSWKALYFLEVFEPLAAAGLQFVGSGSLMDNLVELSTPSEFVSYLRQITDPIEFETTRDFIVNRFFRGDVFIKPGRPGEAQFDDVLMGAPVAAAERKPSLKVRDQQINLVNPLAERILHLLDESPRTPKQLAEDPEIAKLARPHELKQNLLMLICSAQLAPYRDQGFASKECERIRVSPLNRLQLERCERGASLASSAAGSSALVRPLEALLMRGLETEDPVGWVWKQMERRGQSMSSDKERIEGEEQNRQAINNALGMFRSKKLPKLIHLGVARDASTRDAST